MSSAGQMDPVAALASLQQQMPPGAAMSTIDPVEALASGHSIGTPAPTVQPVAQGVPYHGPAWADPSGMLSTAAHGVMNGAMFNLVDPMNAAISAALPMKGYNSAAPTFSQRYDENLSFARGDTEKGRESHPNVALGASIAGGFLNPVSRALPVPKSLGSALLQGAGMGGAYSAGADVGSNKPMGDILKDTGFGAATGAGIGAGGYGLGKLLTGATRSAPAQLLHDEGVPLTIGESLGGTPQTLEDATTHIPMLGNAIKGRQGEAIEGFNRAAYNRTLEPLGLQYALPPTAKVGNEGIAKIGDIIGKAYDDAYDGVTIQQTPKFTANITQAIQDADSVLPKDRVTQIAKNINTRLIGKFNANGDLSNDDLIGAKNWFAEQSRAGPNASLDEKAIAKAYGAVTDALKDGVGEADPDKGALLNAADNAYMRYVKLGQAASQNQASGRGGVFTPAQLGAAIRTTDNSTRRMNFAKGTAPMQDLAQAGQQVLPSTVPDSGTAIRGLLELGAGGAAAHMVEPSAVLPALGAIGAGTAVYSRPGQALSRALLFGAPGARKAMGALPPALTPGLIAALLSASPGSKP